MKSRIWLIGLGLFLLQTSPFVSAQTEIKAESGARLIPIVPGWAGNSVNVVVFRRNSITSHGDTQYAAFYDQDQNVILAKRRLSDGSAWEIHRTQYTGDVRDAHNEICIGVDGNGVVHLAWDHHSVPLRYAKGIAPESLEMGEKIPMTSQHESRVTYPEFHNLPHGDLLFIYRDGASGNGNLVMNRFDVKSGKWEQLQENLITGQGRRNAYSQAAVDEKGTIHLSWVWRESPDVASNHDLCYAKSIDGGKTWTNSAGKPYAIPITQETAELAAHIPQQHELINQTSMSTDSKGRPYIATYWRDEGSEIPQYHIVYHDGSQWRTSTIGGQTLPFRLAGAGSKHLPLSRPQIFTDTTGATDKAYLLFRDEGRGSRVSVATCDDLSAGHWKITDLTTSSVGMWEPSYDVALWARQHTLHAFVQYADQADAEGISKLPAQMVYVLEWQPAP